MLLLQELQIRLFRVGLRFELAVEIEILLILPLEVLGLFSQLLARKFLTHRRGCTARATAARGADRAAPLVVQVA